MDVELSTLYCTWQPCASLWPWLWNQHSTCLEQKLFTAAKGKGDLAICNKDTFDSSASKEQNWLSTVFRRGILKPLPTDQANQKWEFIWILELTLLRLTDYNDVCKRCNFAALLYNLHSVNNVPESRFNKFVCIFMQMPHKLANEPGKEVDISIHGMPSTKCPIITLGTCRPHIENQGLSYLECQLFRISSWKASNLN